MLVVASGCAVATATPSPTPPASASAELPPLQRHFADETPAHVPPGAFDCVVLIYDGVAKSLGTGIVVAPDRILTAAHVALGLPVIRGGRRQATIDTVAMDLELVAAGDMDLPHGDWAVLAAQKPHWQNIATVHPAARTLGWQPQLGTDVMLVGYAAGFFPDGKIDVSAPTPSVTAKMLAGGVADRSWYAVGGAYELGGMSGGPAMVWNAELQRPELFGVFRGYVGITHATQESSRWLGVVTSTQEKTRRGIAFEIHALPLHVLPVGVPSH